MPQLQMVLYSPYYSALLIGIAFAAALSWRSARRDGVNLTAWATLLAGGAAAGLIGSKFLFFDLQPAVSGEKTILGGLLLGVPIVMALAWVLGLGGARSLDRLTVPTLAAMAIGRVGCYFAECCLGVHSELLGHRHPTVLYEAALDVVLLSVIARRVPRKRAGHVIGVGVTGYAGIRFATEFLRDRPEFSSAINPVQWLMLLTLIGIGSWTLLHAREPAKPSTGATAAPCHPTLAAVVVSASILGVALGMTPWVVPAEQVVLIAMGAGLALIPLRTLRFAQTVQLAPRVALASAPALGLYLMLQQQEPSENAQVQPRRAKFTLGSKTWGSYYDKHAGQLPDVFVPAGCDPGGCDGGGGGCWDDHYASAGPVFASRSTRVSAVTATVDFPVKAPSQLAMDGMLFAGSDRSTRPPEAVSLFGVETVHIRGFALGLSTGEPNFLLRFGVLGGALSRNGALHNGLTPNVMVRVGAARGFYIEASGISEQYLATHGEFTHVGIGYILERSQARAFYGAGNGQLFSAHFPIGRLLQVDITRREPDSPKDVPGVEPSWQLGASYRFR